MRLKREVATLEILNEMSRGSAPLRAVRVIEAIERAAARHLHVGASEEELATHVVEGEHVHASAHC